MLCGRPCCHGNEIWARRGDPVAYRLVFVSVDSRYRSGIHFKYINVNMCMGSTARSVNAAFNVLHAGGGGGGGGASGGGWTLDRYHLRVRTHARFTHLSGYHDNASHT